ncbi:MAG: molybdopterin-binding protein [Conexivisphaerales archaeon]
MTSQQVLAEILCVGNEILMGRTLDTNSNWLSRRLYEIGARVRRITVVGDDVGEIAAAVEEACNRKEEWLIVTGGLGPTYDDKTLQGIAQAAKVPLVFSEEAMRMVQESVRRRGITTLQAVDEKTVSEGRRKMATIPENSRPLQNPVGTAPGVLVRVKDTNVVSLPGVPDEMKGIFDTYVADMISSRKQVVKGIDVTVYGVPEAAMAGIISELVSRYPDIYIKTHPAGYERVSKVIVQFTGRGVNAGEVDDAVKAFKEWLDKRNSNYELTFNA